MDQESINLVPDGPSIDPAAVQRELAHSLERTETIGQAIEEALDAAERELAEIRRDRHSAAHWRARPQFLPLPILHGGEGG